MENKIKELKELALAYSIALLYDYVPDYNDIDADTIEQVLTENPYFIDDPDAVLWVVTRYNGYSTTKLESTIFDLVRTF